MSILTALIVSVLTSAPAQTVSLVGTTVDGEGKPVAGAELWLIANLGPDDSPTVARGRSDEHGRFSIERPATLAGLNVYRTVTLWAHRPGLRVARLPFPGKLPGPDQPVRLELGPPAGKEIRVVAHDDRPVASARIRFERIDNFRELPDPIASRLELTTGPDGRAVLDSIAPEDLRSVEVRAEGFGDQPRTFYPPTRGPKLVRLRTASSATGRLVADDPRVVKGWKVSAWTTPADGQTDRNTYWVGHAEAVTDDQGRFRIPAIAAGKVSLTCNPPQGIPYRAKAPAWPSLSINGPNDIEVPVLKAARVAGVFRDRETKEPVPGVRINFYSQVDGNRFHITDAQGRFAEFALPAELHIRAIHTPAPYVATPVRGNRTVKLPDGVDHLDLEPFELIRRGPPLAGVAVDDAGRPVSEATVTGAWRLPQEKDARILTAETTSDEHGRFNLIDMAPGAEVKVFARHRELALTEPVMARVGQAERLTVRLGRAGTAAIRGRVLGPCGRPLADAAIVLQLSVRNDCIGFVMGPFTFDENRTVRTGHDGSFQTPHQLLRIGTYRLTATADGFVQGQSDEIELAAGDVTAVPDLALKKEIRLRAVAGRLLDRHGSPIAEAEVVQSGDGPNRNRTRTDAQGGFRIHGVAEGPAFLFAEKPGYRFGGQRIDEGVGPVELVLGRWDKSVGPPRQRAAWPVPRVEERAIARKLLDPVVAMDPERDRFHQRETALLAMGRVDPDRVLEMLENRVISQGQGVLNAAALGLLEAGPHQALQTIEADHDPASRIAGYLALFDDDPAAPAEFRRDLLERALAESRRVDNLGAKASLLARIGGSWLALGDAGRAAPILRNARAILGRSDQARNPWGIQGLAGPLALVDLPSALAMAEGPDGSRARSNPQLAQMELGEIAWRIAGTNPDEAELLVGRLGNRSAFRHDAMILRACGAMAAADLQRARRLAAAQLRPSIHPNGPVRPTLELYAHAVMADGLADSDPAAAKRLLEETIAQLRRLGTEDRERHETPSVACLIAGCLPLVERLVPDRREECLALAIASRPARLDEPDVADLRSRALLAALVARYDPPAAEVIARPVFEDVPALAVPPRHNQTHGSLETIFAALAGVDPRRAADLVEQLPEDHEYTDIRFKGSPGSQPWWIDLKTKGRIAVGRMLGLPIERRRQEIAKLVVDPWLLRRAR
jgi:hypothetical protein